MLARCTRPWRDALRLVRPDTLLRWDRDLFKVVWKWKSRPKGQPKRLPQETIDLIREMAVATWETFIRNHTNNIWACDFLCGREQAHPGGAA